MNKILIDSPSNEWLTTREVACLFRVHITTVRRWSRCGVMKSYRVGPRGHRRYLADDILACMQKINSDGPSGEKGADKQRYS